MPVEPLSDRDRAILDFEKEWWKAGGAKATAIRDLFEISDTRYYQLLNRIIDDQAAIAYAPTTVKRLARMRATRRKARSVR
ncbi:MAG: DUF3263 domain-containing protein [bacterium]|nr:DUF3263 domain-containing protein [bacterium]